MSENAAEDVYVNMRCEECANRATGVKDQCPAGGGHYSVTAVDGAGNESVPAGPVQVRV